jgi:hypothetical protein
MAWPPTGIIVIGGGVINDNPPVFDPPVLPDIPPTGSGVGGGSGGGGGELGGILTGMISYTNMSVGYFKINLEQSVTNMYGESLEKWYYPPVQVPCLIERGDYDNPEDEFGVDVSQTLTVKIIRDTAQSLNFLPEVGDILTDQERYYEVKVLNTSIITIPGAGGAQNNVSSGNAGEIILYGLTCYLTRITKLNIIPYYQ